MLCLPHVLVLKFFQYVEALLCMWLLSQETARLVCWAHFCFQFGLVSSEEEGLRCETVEWRDDIHILPCFGSKQRGSVKELMKSVRVPVVMTLPPTWKNSSSCWFSVGVGGQIPSPADLFWINELGFLKSPSLYDVSTGKCLFWSRSFLWHCTNPCMKWRLGKQTMLFLLPQTDECSTANVWREPYLHSGK